MPALPHTIPGRPFRLEESPAVNWLLAQPELRNWLFGQLAGKKLIAYDAATGTWRGADASNPHVAGTLPERWSQAGTEARGQRA